MTSRTRHALMGTAFVLVNVVLVYLALALFRQDFTKTEPLTVQASRAGLMMDSGSVVKLRGVDVGRVTEVRAGGPGAVIQLAILPKYLKLIPADVQAQIVPPTLFGSKYIDLLTPGPGTTPIAAHAVIPADNVTVEVNAAFAHLMDLLGAASPAQVNGALTAIATALDGRGGEIRDLIALTDRYLRQINPELPTIQDDIRRGADVSATYADLAPNLVDIGSNVATTSDTLVSQQASLQALLVSMTGFANQTSTLLKDNQRRLTGAVNTVAPTAALLAEYAPILPCFIRQDVYALNAASPAIGGVVPGINMYSAFLPGQDPYQYPNGLPVVGANAAPSCYEAPNNGAKIAQRHAFDVGTDPYAGDKAGGGAAGTAGGAGSALSTTGLGLLLGLTSVVTK